MAASHDNKRHISEKIAIYRGYAAMFSSAADDLQRMYDLCAEAESRAEAESEGRLAEKRRADAAEKEVEYWKKQVKPTIILRDNARIDELVEGNKVEIYGKDDSIQGQQPVRRIGVG